MEIILASTTKKRLLHWLPSGTLTSSVPLDVHCERWPAMTYGRDTDSSNGKLKYMCTKHILLLEDTILFIVWEEILFAGDDLLRRRGRMILSTKPKEWGIRCLDKPVRSWDCMASSSPHAIHTWCFRCILHKVINA